MELVAYSRQSIATSNLAWREECMHPMGDMSREIKQLAEREGFYYHRRL